MSDILTEIRNTISSFGGSELEAKANMPALAQMWDKMQDLKREMNEAKKKAAEEAAKPYLEAMEEVQRRYAFIMKMSS
jgi:hypothetical protein